MATPRRRPTAPGVARVVEADPDHLAEFVDVHPRPTVKAVVEARFTDVSPGELDQATRDEVAAWIEYRKESYRDDPRHNTYEYIAQHQPVKREKIVTDVAAGTEHLRSEVRRALIVLREGGYITREDVGDKPWKPQHIYRTAADDPDES